MKIALEILDSVEVDLPLLDEEPRSLRTPTT